MRFVQDGLMTLEEAAAHLGCSVATIWRRVGAKRLRTIRVLGRTVVFRDEVNELRAEQERCP